MSYLQDRKIKKRKYFKTALGIGLLITFFYFRVPIFRALSYASGEIFRPVLSAGRGLGRGFGNFGAYFSSKRALSRENEKLREELEAGYAERFNYDVFARENESLKEILGRLPENREFILAAILSKPNQSPYDTLLIDLGTRRGIETGDLVYAYGDVPLGRVAETTPDTSKIILFSSAGEKTQVIISDIGSGASEIFWELVGRGGGNFEMILPREFVLAEGAIVTLTGIRAEAVAQVETILSDPRDAFKKALFRSPVNIQAIKFVEVEIQ